MLGPEHAADAVRRARRRLDATVPDVLLELTTALRGDDPEMADAARKSLARLMAVALRGNAK